MLVEFRRVHLALHLAALGDGRHATRSTLVVGDGEDLVPLGGGGVGDVEELLEAPEDEEHQQTLREEIERKYYPERYDFWPFWDPFINKRKREATKRRQQGQRQWYDED